MSANDPTAIIDDDMAVPDTSQRRAQIRVFSRTVGPGTILLILVVATVISLFARLHFLADLVANLRLQGVIAITVALAWTSWMRLGKWVALGVLLLAFHGMHFRDSFLDRSLAISNDRASLKLLSTNVLTSNSRHDDVIAELKASEADVIVVIELSSRLAKRLNDELSSTYPFQMLRDQDQGNFGIGVISKHPFDSQRVMLSDAGLVSLDLRISGYRVLATHPLPPIGSALFESRNQHLRTVAEAARGGRGDHSPHNLPVKTILVGDLNLTPWSPLFGDLESASGLRRATCGHTIDPTWYMLPWFPFGLALDHALISPDLKCIDYQIGPNTGSDHRSVSFTLVSAESTSPEDSPEK